jgi:RNA polymerase sigma factor (sigma-70 family)
VGSGAAGQRADSRVLPGVSNRRQERCGLVTAASLRLLPAPPHAPSEPVDIASAVARVSCRLRLVRDTGLSLLEERELCARAKTGDRHALGEILRIHGPRLYRAILLPKLGRKAAAEEALSVTYGRIVERFGQFEWQDVGIYPWLRVIALHVAIDMLRREKRERLFEPEDLERTVEAARHESNRTAEELERQDLEYSRQRVIALLERVNPRYATAIRMRVLEGSSREHCADVLAVTLGTFDVLLHRALAALKRELGREPEATA